MVRTSQQIERVISRSRTRPASCCSRLSIQFCRGGWRKPARWSVRRAFRFCGPILNLFQSYLGTDLHASGGRAAHAQRRLFQADRRAELHHDERRRPDARHARTGRYRALGVSRTSKTPTSIYLANRGFKTANVPMVPHVPLPRGLRTLAQSACRRTGRFARTDRADPAEPPAFSQCRLRDGPMSTGRRLLRRSPLPAGYSPRSLADYRRIPPLDRGNRRRDPRPVPRPSSQIHSASVSAMPVLTAPDRLWMADAPLVLASRSTSRRTLLEAVGLSALAIPADVDERALQARFLGRGHRPEGLAAMLAEAKALAVSAGRPDAYCVGADPRLLTVGGKLLHKPVGP